MEGDVRMRGLNNASLVKIVERLSAKGKEGDYWDYKQEWHDKMEDLIKDIICFANTPHDENCYLLFGLRDDGQIVGMKREGYTQANIIDTLENLKFAGGIMPEISVDTVKVNQKQIDVLTIYNTMKTPIYLETNYGEMYAGCIYLRKGDKNTPNKGRAGIEDVEKLWKKRFGLLQTPLEYISGNLQNKREWKQQGNIYFYMYRPEYHLKILDRDDGHAIPEYYAYTMTNENTSYECLQIMAGNVVLEEQQLVILDGGRLRIPTPEWGCCGYGENGNNPKFVYKFFIEGSLEYRLYQFYLDDENEDVLVANNNLMAVVLVYETDEEKRAFDEYIERNQELIEKRIAQRNEYSYVQDKKLLNKDEIIRRLRTGLVLNELLCGWRIGDEKNE